MAPIRIETIKDLRLAVADAKTQGHSVGFVPTMGFLHEGHGSLLALAAKENSFVVLSIFVNPLQFNERFDLANYPKDDKRDDTVAAAYGTNIIFAPSTAEMYPNGEPNTTMKVGGVTEVLEGEFRPGHFDGVSLVVAKLLNIVMPSKAYFGQKDYQQLVTIKQMAADLSIGCEIIGCPIVRDHAGLALSSRNSLLSKEERQRSSLLFEALKAGRQCFIDGGGSAAEIERSMRLTLEGKPDIKIDYAVIVDCDTLLPMPMVSAPFQLLVAATIGTTRLIDNIRVDGKTTKPYRSRQIHEAT